jgi:hypothetical protein
MSETRTFTASDLRTAVAVGVKRDRARVGAIVALPEAAGRHQLALTLATTTDMTVDQVRASLAAAPTAADSGRGAASPIGPSTEQPSARNDTNTGDVSAIWNASLKSRGFKIA